MNKFYLKTILLCLLSLVSITSFAYDCEVDGVYYNLNGTDRTASVTYKSFSTGYNEDYTPTTITIPSSITVDSFDYAVKSIGTSAFYGCRSLTSVTIPNSVTEIDFQAFRDCSGLTSVTISNSVTSIGECAFQGCSGLTSVTIGNSVTSIGNWAFCDCSGLTSVTIPNSVTEIGYYAFSGCSGLTELVISNSVISIGIWAFSDCSGLTSVTIPNSVTSIGFSAFYGCSGLTSVVLPNSVTSIGEYVFDYCSSLTSVISLIQEPNDIPTTAFLYSYNNPSTIYDTATLYVPKGTADKYRAREGWKGFKNIVEGDPSSITLIGNEESDATETERYDINGKRIVIPQRGINVVKMSDGTVKKVLVK